MKHRVYYANRSNGILTLIWHSM